jgi:hypothetical protein
VTVNGNLKVVTVFCVFLEFDGSLLKITEKLEKKLKICRF